MWTTTAHRSGSSFFFFPFANLESHPPIKKAQEEIWSEKECNKTYKEGKAELYAMNQRMSLNLTVDMKGKTDHNPFIFGI